MPDLRRCKRWSLSGTNGGKVLKVDTVEVEEDENVETVKSRRHSASEIVVSLTLEGVALKDRTARHEAAAPSTIVHGYTEVTRFVVTCRSVFALYHTVTYIRSY